RLHADAHGMPIDVETAVHVVEPAADIQVVIAFAADRRREVEDEIQRCAVFDMTPVCRLRGWGRLEAERSKGALHRLQMAIDEFRRRDAILPCAVGVTCLAETFVLDMPFAGHQLAAAGLDKTEQWK